MPIEPVLSRIAHVILRVSDLPRSVAYYKDMLGLTMQASFPGFAFFAAGGVTLVLNENKAAAAAAGRVPDGVPATEIVFETTDIHAAHAALKSRGVAFAREPRVVTSDATHDTLATDFCDPDGHVLSITGRVARRPG